MLEAMAALILAIVGALLILAVSAYGIYVTFYPLSKTVKSGIEAAKAPAEEGRLHEGKMPEPIVAKYA
jgi:hypothetical protein